MQAVLYTLVFPVLPYILWRSYNKEKKVRIGEVILRYLFYLLIISVISAILLAILSDAGTSFLEKMDKSAAFALKYAFMEFGGALLTAWGEWSILKKKTFIKVDWNGFASWKPVIVCKKYICPVLPYLIALLVVCLNVSLMFDNVVWGDEAFSIKTAKSSMYGVLQILYYLDNHPPLYYYWLKLWGELFGFSIPVCHLASVFPFAMGILLALFGFRKKFGAVPAAFFVVLSGLGTFCLKYNLEIRMYALAFFCLAACFWCAYGIISTGKKSFWIGMVLWGVAGAYSHYYALVAGGLIVFFTGVAVWLRDRGKTWIKGLGAVLAFLVLYGPWMYILYRNIVSVGSNWWVTEILKFEEAVDMVFGGGKMVKITLPLLIGLCIPVLLADSGIIRMAGKEEDCVIEIHRPSLKKWDDKTYAVVIGLFTIAGTIAFGYFLCVVMTPVLIARYLYPLSVVVFCLLVIAAGRMLELLKKLGVRTGFLHLQGIGKGVLVFILCVLLVMGFENFKNDSETVRTEKKRTQITLDIIGAPEQGVNMVTNGVRHLGWTVLEHYYPDNEIINGNLGAAGSDCFWYFNPVELSEESIEEIEKSGMSVEVYGENQISQYPFYLYYIEKNK